MDDAAILSLYIARNEEALEQTRYKYGHYCRCIAASILCNQEDADEVCNDVLLQTWNAIPPARPRALKLFLAKVTRNLAFSRWRSKHAQCRCSGETEIALGELADCVPGREQVDDALNAKELTETINTFLGTLHARDRNIFLRRYFYVEDIGTIASAFTMKPSNVLRILSRTRAKLKAHLIQEGYDL